MKLSQEEQKEYYLKVARDLINDGVTGWTEESLAEHLINDPGNPFRPLSRQQAGILGNSIAERRALN